MTVPIVVASVVATVVVSGNVGVVSTAPRETATDANTPRTNTTAVSPTDPAPDRYLDERGRVMLCVFVTFAVTSPTTRHIGADARWHVP
jgi:hypothetical protein